MNNTRTLFSLLVTAPLLGGCLALQNLPSNTALGCDTGLAGHWTRPDTGAGNTPIIISDTCELSTDSHALYYLVSQAESVAMAANQKNHPIPSRAEPPPVSPVQLRFSTFQHQGQVYLRFDPQSFQQILNATTPATTSTSEFPLPQHNAQRAIVEDKNAHMLLRYKLEGDTLKITILDSITTFEQLIQDHGESAFSKTNAFLITLSPSKLDSLLPTISPTLRIPNGPEMPPLELRRSPHPTDPPSP